MKRLLSLAAVMILCSGCAMSLWRKPTAEEYVSAGLDLRMMLPSAWMRYTQGGPILILTQDGITLNIIRARFFRFKDKLEFTKRKFTEDMTPLDLSEVEIDNLKSDPQVSKLEVLANKPATVGGTQAYFIEYTFETAGGLKAHGQQYGFIANERVYRINFEAAEQFYYPKSVKDFGPFIQSIKIMPK